MFSIYNWPLCRVPLLKYAAAILMRAATGGLPCKVQQKASGWLLSQLLISVIRASKINLVPLCSPTAERQMASTLKERKDQISREEGESKLEKL